MSQPLLLSRVHYPVTTLGPGSRLGIWFQGCSIRCPGCISVDTWVSSGQPTTVEDLLEAIRPWLNQADGITLTGGEPFDQRAALTALVAALRSQAPEVDILVYSGYSLRQLEVDGIPEGIDALMTEPFRLEFPETLALRGSDNQELHLLSKRGESRLGPYERARTDDDQRLDFHADASGVIWMAGIPRRGDLRQLEQLLQLQGSQLSTSEQRLGAQVV